MLTYLQVGGENINTKNMNAKEFNKLLLCLPDGSKACLDALVLAKGKDFKTAWETCERGEWMLWLAKKMQDTDGWCDLRNLTLAKARCAKLALDLMNDGRSKKAVEMAEQFGLGNASLDKLNSSAHPYSLSYADAAAFSAAHADSDADTVAHAISPHNTIDGSRARKEILKQCADICRETLIVPL